MQFGLEPRTGGGRVSFRHQHVDAQLVRVGDTEQFRSGALACIDQRADIGVARGDRRRRKELGRA